MRALALLLLACSAQARTADDFAFDLLKAVSRKAGDRNVFLSPASARWALGMTYQGARGRTQTEMAAVLGAAAPRAQAAADEERVASLLKADGPVKLRVANSLWLRRGYPFDEANVRAAARAYRAESFVREFGRATVDEANAWASRKTEGRIPRIIELLDPSDSMVLMNAVYFKGDWENSFEKAGTTEELFRPDSGAPAKARLMRAHRKWGYFEKEGLQAVALPYKGGRLRMIAVLPPEGTRLDALLSSLDAARWSRLRAGLESRREGTVRLPRFKLEFGAKLGVVLSGMGMPTAFRPFEADFTGFQEGTASAQRMFIGEVLQKTFVEVNEEGTEAAAVTAVIMKTRGASAGHGPPPFRFVADRPFLYAIEDAPTGELLFLGAFRKP